MTTKKLPTPDKPYSRKAKKVRTFLAERAVPMQAATLQVSDNWQEQERIFPELVHAVLLGRRAGHP